jgi:large subunit ribosomal protein L25
MATTIAAEKRTEIGSGPSRRLRLAGKIPAILYGDADPQPLTLDAKGFRAAMAGHGSGLVSLSIEGGKEVNALIKEIQRDPIKDIVDHVDLQKVSLTETIHSTVPVRLHGEAPGIKMGGVLQHTLWEIEVQAQAQNLPDSIDVDVSSLEFGQAIHVADLTPPPGVELMALADVIIVSVVAPQVQVLEEVAEPTEEEEAAAAAAAEEGAEEAAEPEPQA